MVGDVRSVAQQRTVHVALVLAAGAGVRQAHVSRGIVVDEAAGGREPVRPEGHFLIVLREFEGEDQRGFVDDGFLGVAAGLDDRLLHLVLQAQGGDHGLEAAAAFDRNALVSVAGEVAGLLARVIERILREGSRVGFKQGVDLEEIGSAVPEEHRRVLADAVELGFVV